MPLIIITGLPCTGKTTRALQLKDYLIELGKNVVLVSEHDYVKDRNHTYNSSADEKTVRASVKAAVMRTISSTCVVVVDAPNYIKGYRYELYCAAKQHSTTQCVVACVCSIEAAWRYNTARPPDQQYSRPTFDALVFRYESPDSRNRWDAPLFSVVNEGSLDLAAVAASLWSGKSVKPHQATQLQPLTATNFLQALDNTTKDVVATIMTAQKTEVGGEIRISGSEKPVNLGRKVSLAEVSRARRQFISYTRSRPQQHTDVTAAFVAYLNTTLA